jgi:hypothetical protein
VFKVTIHLKYGPASLDILPQTFRDNALVSPSLLINAREEHRLFFHTDENETPTSFRNIGKPNNKWLSVITQKNRYLQAVCTVEVGT